MQSLVEKIDNLFSGTDTVFVTVNREEWQTLKPELLARQTNNSAMDAIAWLERCFKYVPDCTWRDDLRKFIEAQRHQ